MINLESNTPKITAGTIIRFVVLILALVNQGLSMAGMSPLPIEDGAISEFISLGITIGASAWAWWKDNDITKKARENKALINEGKGK